MARTSGILLHPTSLPGRFGIGELGPEAFRFAEWLARAGQKLWQVLPLGPTGYGESPYQLFSAFAGNPWLLSLERLVERGWLRSGDLSAAPAFSTRKVEFERVMPWKNGLLLEAFARFRPDAEYEAFCRQHAWWLDDFARFMSLKAANGGVEWSKWDSRIPERPEDQEFHRFLQFEFFRQWRELKRYCADLGIRMMGDIPIYVAHDSADVWAHPELFRADAVSGVPPDYFSATGQLWGNPLYHWDRLAADGYSWWVKRMRAALEWFDLVRMDHFRGFEAFWEVPAGELTAVKGRWVKGPGAGLFRELQKALGPLPIVAENLGVITPEVEAIREEFGFPGMAVLQFAFGKDPQAPGFRPHNYVRNLVAYTGTHDNDTVMGWWHSSGGDSTRTAQDVEEEKQRARRYLAADGAEMNWLMIRALLGSVADTVLFPMQDVVGLGTEGRMNVPSVASGNWRWRVRAEALTEERAARLHEMVRVYER
ncbi:MAG TPA: 4-alpha-glucanotransferase [Bryobacteraceae bacterium]|nr:4-alpha-glucanotransferase [Bryobacteraceae bacterium]